MISKMLKTVKLLTQNLLTFLEFYLYLVGLAVIVIQLMKNKPSGRWTGIAGSDFVSITALSSVIWIVLAPRSVRQNYLSVGIFSPWKTDHPGAGGVYLGWHKFLSIPDQFVRCTGMNLLP